MPIASQTEAVHSLSNYVGSTTARLCAGHRDTVRSRQQGLSSQSAQHGAMLRAAISCSPPLSAMVLTGRSTVVLGCLSPDNLPPSTGQRSGPSSTGQSSCPHSLHGASDFCRLLEKRETWSLGPVCPYLPQNMGFSSPKTNVALGDVLVVECHETLVKLEFLARLCALGGRTLLPIPVCVPAPSTEPGCGASYIRE